MTETAQPTKVHPTVDEAVNAVAAEIEPIAKTQSAQGGGYTYRGIDAVMNALSPLMHKHGVRVVPHDIKDLTAEWVHTYKPDGTVKRSERLVAGTYVYMVRGPAGDHYPGALHAESMNNRDKAAVSMSSYAWRTFACLLFGIPTDAPEPEEDNSDASPISGATIDDSAVARLIAGFDQILSEDDRKIAKHSFVEQFGPPPQLSTDRLGEALDWVDRAVANSNTVPAPA